MEIRIVAHAFYLYITRFGAVSMNVAHAYE